MENKGKFLEKWWLIPTIFQISLLSTPQSGKEIRMVNEIIRINYEYVNKHGFAICKTYFNGKLSVKVW